MLGDFSPGFYCREVRPGFFIHFIRVFGRWERLSALHKAC